FSSLVAASRKSAALLRTDIGGALTRRRYNGSHGQPHLGSMLLFCVLVCALTCTAKPSAWPAPKDLSTNEHHLIAILKPKTPPDHKALACKRLAVYGSSAAVSSIAPLLTDKALSSWARIALEAIPGSASDDALRHALNKTEGRLLVGVINSIGVPQDAKAI